jgi:hypothetical protein
VRRFNYVKPPEVEMRDIIAWLFKDILAREPI